MAETAIAGLIVQNPGIKTEIDQSLGYAVANMKLTKVPVVGAGGGEGVFVNKTTQQRTYFTVSRFDRGGGWGARSYPVTACVRRIKAALHANSRQEACNAPLVSSSPAPSGTMSSLPAKIRVLSN